MDNPNLKCMTQGTLSLPIVLHKLPNRAKRMNIKFNVDKTVKAEDHLDNFYLQLQTLEVRFDDVSCRLFPYTLDGHAARWYHILPPNSIYNLGAFKHMFLENFVDDKTPTMLLKELGSLKMEAKEKLKDFNHRFTCMLNKFAADTKPHDSIAIDYYTSALPTNIAQFFKQAMKPTLLENCEEATAIEKNLHEIRVVKDDESTKDSKDASKKSQAMASNGSDMEATDIETLTRLVKNLTTEVFELKQQKWTHLQVDIHLDRDKKVAHQAVIVSLQKLHRILCSISNSVQILSSVLSMKNIIL